jgi:2-amino-4-hydroxy-6-hydroxymethyldihydropteridine diphosphokinase
LPPGAALARGVACENPVAAAGEASVQAARMTPPIGKRARKLMKESTIAYIGLGANLGQRDRTIGRALDEIDRLPGTHVSMVSRFHETKPVGVVDQPDFVNAVARIETTLSARELLDGLLAIECRLGRRRNPEQRWGPRTIDLDLLLFGQERIEEDGLEVPHPRLTEREFVTRPLREVMHESRLPVPGQGVLTRGD